MYFTLAISIKSRHDNGNYFKRSINNTIPMNQQLIFRSAVHKIKLS